MVVVSEVNELSIDVSGVSVVKLCQVCSGSRGTFHIE